MDKQAYEVLPPDWRPDVSVPDDIWKQVRTWDGDHTNQFDIRLSCGQVLKRMCIDNDGGIHGQSWDDGINMSAVYFGSDDIVAIRRRTGSILDEAGLTSWKRRKKST